MIQYFLEFIRARRAQDGGLTWGWIVTIILVFIGLVVILYAMVKAGKLGAGHLGGLR